MQIGILSKVFARPSLEAVLDAVAASGLECIQFNMESAGLNPLPDEIPAGLPERVRDAATSRGIGIATVQGTFNMSHPDAEFRRAGLRRFRLIVEACEYLALLGTYDFHGPLLLHGLSETLVPGCVAFLRKGLG